jgi:hypothetical protein
MGKEQAALLKEQRHLNAKQADISQHLANNAEEFILKAQLTATDYSDVSASAWAIISTRPSSLFLIVPFMPKSWALFLVNRRK